MVAINVLVIPWKAGESSTCKDLYHFNFLLNSLLLRGLYYSIISYKANPIKKIKWCILI